jgi:hypothetical protein
VGDDEAMLARADTVDVETAEGIGEALARRLVHANKRAAQEDVVQAIDHRTAHRTDARRKWRSGRGRVLRASYYWDGERDDERRKKEALEHSMGGGGVVSDNLGRGDGFLQ